MSTDNTITKTDLKNILEEIGNIGGGGGSVDSTSIPTASKVSEFDSNAKMNSTDMGSSDVSTFVNDLAVNNVTPTLLDIFYPVGTIYQTLSVTFNPNTVWGGTWIKIEEGRFLQATETSTDVGDTVAAGLPNITGGFAARSTNYNASPTMYPDNGTNFIAYSQGGLNVDSVNQVNGSVTGWHYTFDASRVSSVYGNSTTVQPPSVKVYMWHRTA